MPTSKSVPADLSSAGGVTESAAAAADLGQQAQHLVTCDSGCRG
jgi:hypothetical protein